MLVTGTPESKLGFARSHLVLSLPRPDRAASPQDSTSSTGLWGNSHLKVPPRFCRGSLTSMCVHGNGPVFPHKAGFHIKLEHLLLFLQGCTRTGIPSSCSEKGVPWFCSHELREVCIQVSVS